MTTNSDRRAAARSAAPVTLVFEGRAVVAYKGETVAAALLAAGENVLRNFELGDARGVLCGIGICWECRCVIDGRPNTRACVTDVRDGMIVERQEGLG
jgi:predicted molibdopterin-dependent oxidoreductase YjgC